MAAAKPKAQDHHRWCLLQAFRGGVRRRARHATTALATIAGFLATACTALPSLPFAEAATEPSPDGAAEHIGEQGESVGAAAWWKSFDDPELDRVVALVLEANFDIATAVARVEQARAKARVAVAARLPMVQAAFGASEFDAPTNVGFGAQLQELGGDAFALFDVPLPDRLDQATYSAGLDFAYEIDFWGRDTSAARAAHSERLASEADLRAARMGVVAETVATYLEIVDLGRQHGYAKETVRILGEWAVLAEDRYERGVGDVRDVYAIRRNLRDAEAALPGITARRTDAQGRLQVLAGGGDAELVADLSESMPSPALTDSPVVISAETLAQRPDVAAARQRLAAAGFALDARRAALLPSLSLSGSIGLQSSQTDVWFDPDQWFRNLSSNLLAPVFQGGRLRGNVALAKANLREATSTYGKAVATATAEVGAALAALESSRERASLLASRAGEADAEKVLQERRYAAGIADYRTVLGAAQLEVAALAALAAGERELAYARLALHRAVGGAW